MDSSALNDERSRINPIQRHRTERDDTIFVYLLQVATNETFSSLKERQTKMRFNYDL